MWINTYSPIAEKVFQLIASNVKFYFQHFRLKLPARLFDFFKTRLRDSYSNMHPSSWERYRR